MARRNDAESQCNEFSGVEMYFVSGSVLLTSQAWPESARNDCIV
jgi:hypothetical protein